MKRSFLVALLASFLLAPAAVASTAKKAPVKAPVQVRVVTWQGVILVDRPVVARTTTVPTSRDAVCFGGEPSDGYRTLEGPTAMGALHRVTAGVAGLRPLSLTNAFDFGLGLCAIGRYAPRGEEWWALRVNGALSSTGGDSTLLKRGDHVLWYLDQSFSSPMPDELRLRAPSKSKKGHYVNVRVHAYNGQGGIRPASGVRVLAGGDPVGRTDPTGRIEVQITHSTRLVARAPGLIPSNRVSVKVPATKTRTATR